MYNIYYEKYLKYKKKYLELKNQLGGDTTNIEELDKELSNHIYSVYKILENYSTIYIGIGAKYYTNYPISLNTGINQQVPSFLLSSEEKKLIIIIDSFNGEELIDNTNKIEDTIKGRTDIDYLFINSLFEDNLLKELRKLINDWLSPEQNIYIVSYVSYYNVGNGRIIQNMNRLLEIIKKTLEEKLDETILPSNKNVYRWLGYIEPTHICKLNNFDETSDKVQHLVLNLESDPKNQSLIDKINSIYEENCLKIN
jgi:hypothetical protein